MVLPCVSYISLLGTFRADSSSHPQRRAVSLAWRRKDTGRLRTWAMAGQEGAGPGLGCRVLPWFARGQGAVLAGRHGLVGASGPELWLRWGRRGCSSGHRLTSHFWQLEVGGQ